jgi:hypothetical protein
MTYKYSMLFLWKNPLNPTAPMVKMQKKCDLKQQLYEIVYKTKFKERIPLKSSQTKTPSPGGGWGFACVKGDHRGL